MKCLNLFQIRYRYTLKGADKPSEVQAWVGANSLREVLRREPEIHYRLQVPHGVPVFQITAPNDVLLVADGKRVKRVRPTKKTIGFHTHGGVDESISGVRGESGGDESLSEEGP